MSHFWFERCQLFWYISIQLSSEVSNFHLPDRFDMICPWKDSLEGNSSFLNQPFLGQMVLLLNKSHNDFQIRLCPHCWPMSEYGRCFVSLCSSPFKTSFRAFVISVGGCGAKNDPILSNFCSFKYTPPTYKKQRSSALIYATGTGITAASWQNLSLNTSLFRNLRNK